MRTLILSLLLWTPLFAEEEIAVPESNLLQTALVLAVLASCFYLLFWRPEQKRRQQLQQQQQAITVGDRVIVGGIIGKVANVEQDVLLLALADGQHVEALRSACLAYPLSKN